MDWKIRYGFMTIDDRHRYQALLAAATSGLVVVPLPLPVFEMTATSTW